jgi:hypothetical protein
MDDMKAFALIFGIALLIGGVVASLYQETIDGYDTGRYPYQTVGILLIVVGLIFVGLTLFYSPRKTNDLPPSRAMTNPQQTSSIQGRSGIAKNCPVCNKTISSDSNFCPYCATDLRERRTPPPTNP